MGREAAERHLSSNPRPTYPPIHTFTYPAITPALPSHPHLRTRRRRPARVGAGGARNHAVDSPIPRV